MPLQLGGKNHILCFSHASSFPKPHLRQTLFPFPSQCSAGAKKESRLLGR